MAEGGANYISINMVNIITILVIGMLGTAAVGMVASFVRTAMGKSTAAS